MTFLKIINLMKRGTISPAEKKIEMPWKAVKTKKIRKSVTLVKLTHLL